MFAYANAPSFEEAKVILFGVPDESGSSSYRQGSKKGPDAIRKVSNQRNVFLRDGKKTLVQPQSGTLPSIFDKGNMTKKEISEYVQYVVSAGKIPLMLGGDHSSTFEALRGFFDMKKTSFVYFDSHPDFICSKRGYYGSVICDSLSLQHLDLAKSVEIGIRAPEEEELANIRRKHLTTISMEDITFNGVDWAFKQIKRTVGKHIYLSIDLDVLDPAFAPGVSTPYPGGLSSAQLILLAKKVAGLGLVGMDIMEYNPKFDVQDMTAHLATTLIIETLSQC